MEKEKLAKDLQEQITTQIKISDFISMNQGDFLPV